MPTLYVLKSLSHDLCSFEFIATSVESTRNAVCNNYHCIKVQYYAQQWRYISSLYPLTVWATDHTRILCFPKQSLASRDPLQKTAKLVPVPQITDNWGRGLDHIIAPNFELQPSTKPLEGESHVIVEAAWADTYLWCDREEICCNKP